MGEMTSAPRRRLSERTIARLPVYQRIVDEWLREGRVRLDSVSLAERAGVTATTVRRDLAGLGSLGTRGSGYAVASLREALAEALGQDRSCEVILVGAGNLGRALVNSASFLPVGARLTGLYDADEELVGTEVAGQRVLSAVRGFPSADVAVLCVPAPVAQSVADRCVDAGIRALLNFAPCVLNVPPGTVVHDVDLSIALQVLLYRLNHGGGFWGDLWRSSLDTTDAQDSGPEATAGAIGRMAP